MTPECRTVFFSGRVQGVGFRMTARQLAGGLHVGGSVRNLPDGRVELVVEGMPGDIDTLVARLREHFGAFIRTIDATSASSGGIPRDGLHITS